MHARGPNLSEVARRYPGLDPGRGRTRIGPLWVYTRGDRPLGGPDPPAALYFYIPDRKAEHPASHLEGFRGVLQVDGYAGFKDFARGYLIVSACTCCAIPSPPNPTCSFTPPSARAAACKDIDAIKVLKFAAR